MLRALVGASTLLGDDLGGRLVAPIAAASSTELVDDYVIRRASSVRDLTPSLRNALCKWYSTVLGLMNICPAISWLVAP